MCPRARFFPLMGGFHEASGSGLCLVLIKTIIKGGLFDGERKLWLQLWMDKAGRAKQQVGGTEGFRVNVWVCDCVWWLGDTSGGRHTGLPCVCGSVCVCMRVCVCVCVRHAGGGERRGVTRSPNSCLGDKRPQGMFSTPVLTCTHIYVHTQRAGERITQPQIWDRQTGKQMLRHPARPPTLIMHPRTHHCE